MKNKQGKNAEESLTPVSVVKALLKQYLFFKNFRIDAILALWFVQVFKVTAYCFSLVKWLAQEQVSARRLQFIVTIKPKLASAIRKKRRTTIL